jgi:hypothetical protein
MISDMDGCLPSIRERRVQAGENLPPGAGLMTPTPFVGQPPVLPSATDALKTANDAIAAGRAKKVNEMLRSIGAQIRVVSGAGGVLTRFGHAQVPGIDQHTEEALDPMIVEVAAALKRAGYSVEFVTEAHGTPAVERRLMVVSWERAGKPQAWMR